MSLQTIKKIALSWSVNNDWELWLYKIFNIYDDTYFGYINFLLFYYLNYFNTIKMKRLFDLLKQKTI